MADTTTATQNRMGQAGRENQSEAVRHAEGGLARPIEEYTARLPSDTFLWSAGASLTLMAAGNRHGALFVGQWAPTFLLLGLYNKLVKVAGSDPQHRGMSTNAPTMASIGAGI
jgi:hypothetical protein